LFETWFGIYAEVSCFSILLYIDAKSPTKDYCQALPNINPIDASSKIVDDAFSGPKLLPRDRS
jgi:hypothetical protein